MRETQLAFDRCERHAGCFRDLLERQPAEIPLLDHLRLPRVQRFEALQGVIELLERGGLWLGQDDGFVQVDCDGPSAPLPGASRARLIDQQAAHNARRHREEVGPIPKVRPSKIDEFEICIVNEPGRVDRAVAGFAPQALMREAAQLGIHHRDELVERGAIAVSPRAEQPCDVG